MPVLAVQLVWRESVGIWQFRQFPCRSPITSLGSTDNDKELIRVLAQFVLFDGFDVNAIDARVVDDGDLISGAGVTSGLDLGPYLVERELGPRIANAVEKLFAHERRGTVWRNAGRTPTVAL